MAERNSMMRILPHLINLQNPRLFQCADLTCLQKGSNAIYRTCCTCARSTRECEKQTQSNSPHVKPDKSKRPDDANTFVTCQGNLSHGDSTRSTIFTCRSNLCLKLLCAKFFSLHSFRSSNCSLKPSFLNFPTHTCLHYVIGAKLHTCNTNARTISRETSNLRSCTDMRNFADEQLLQERTDTSVSPLFIANSFITSANTQSQLRHYRGQIPKRQTSHPATADDSELELSCFDKDVATFHSDLQGSENDFERELLSSSVEEMTIPELSRHACNLVPYVNRSKTLQNLVKLGVNLDLVQRVEGVAELLLKSQFERDVAPLIHLLNLMGVPAGAMGLMLTRNPLLFTQSVEDLSARFGYFLHKNFTQAEAASIVVRAPVTLLMDPVKLDSKLGFLQTAFGLKGHEVRLVILKYPKLLPWRRDMIANVRFHLKEFLAFSDPQLRELLLKEPKLYMSNPNRLTGAFDYLFTTMGITREQILLWPGILRTRQHIVRDRHLFLLSRGRAQYDPRQENFVSLKALGSGPDGEFCRNVAKCEEQEFHAFLKTL